MPSIDSSARSLLRLTLAPGLGPILIRRAIEAFGSADAVLGATAASLRRVKGIGEVLARQIAAAIPETDRLADEELALAQSLGVDLLAIGSPAYPPLLAQTPDPPPLLYVRGQISPGALDRYPVAIVGSRSCTIYGREQSERFAEHLAGSGLTIVSGGARGIDAAAHRAALRAKGRTIAVLGCGLAECYPPENNELFHQIASGSGAVVSELPLRTPPNAENFPARNRIISGLSLGVLVIEAGRKSGALITARLAAEDHGREVFALPARVDSSAAEGSLELIKSGGAQMVTHPADILQALETPARHLFHGTHEHRYARPETDGALFNSQQQAAPEIPTNAGLTPSQSSILAALDAPRTLDQLAIELKLDAARLRADITMLEIRRRIARRGSKFERIGT
jgi:DNA processing protein